MQFPYKRWTKMICCLVPLMSQSVWKEVKWLPRVIGTPAHFYAVQTPDTCGFSVTQMPPPPLNNIESIAETHSTVQRYHLYPCDYSCLLQTTLFNGTTLQSGIEGGVAISGGLEKSLKVNKRGGCNKRGGWNKLQGECLWMGCYKWMWREDQHMH